MRISFPIFYHDTLNEWMRSLSKFLHICSPMLFIVRYREAVIGTTEASCLTEANTFWKQFYFIGAICLFFFFPMLILILVYSVIACHLVADPCTASNHRIQVLIETFKRNSYPDLIWFWVEKGNFIVSNVVLFKEANWFWNLKKKLLKNAKNWSQINLGSKQKEEVLDVMNMDPFCLFSKMLSFWYLINNK